MSITMSCKDLLHWAVRAVPVLFLSGCAAVSPPVSEEATTPADNSRFTEVQASRGGEVFGANCAVCHGAALTGGGGAPPLRGPDFLFGWSAKTSKDLVDYISTTMPPGQAHFLTQGEYEDVAAYILSANNFPAGQTPLSPASPKLIGRPPAGPR